MNGAKIFFDTSVLLYLFSADDAKADRAEECLAGGGVVSVQVLNEFASVASRKLDMTWPEIRECLATVRALCSVVPLTIETHDRAMKLVDEDRLSFYDALIVASALLADCTALLSEDMQDGRKIDGKLTISNPFIVP